MDFETIWYEYAPYLYAIAGIIVIQEIGAVLGICLGAAMLTGAARVLVLRWNHRRLQQRFTQVRESGAESD